MLTLQCKKRRKRDRGECTTNAEHPFTPPPSFPLLNALPSSTISFAHLRRGGYDISLGVQVFPRVYIVGPGYTTARVLNSSLSCTAVLSSVLLEQLPLLQHEDPLHRYPPFGSLHLLRQQLIFLLFMLSLFFLSIFF